MATIALQAAGNALLPGVGGVVGAAIGGYIDNTFLFPPPDTKGPRLDDLKLQYYNNQSKVPARPYAEEIKAMKALTFS